MYICPEFIEAILKFIVKGPVLNGAVPVYTVVDSVFIIIGPVSIVVVFVFIVLDSVFVIVGPV